jgi:hypothetical protein
MNKILDTVPLRKPSLLPPSMPNLRPAYFECIVNAARKTQTYKSPPAARKSQAKAKKK